MASVSGEDSVGVATTGASGVAFVTVQGVHKARKPPKQGLVRGGGLDQAVQHLLIAAVPIAVVTLALGLLWSTTALLPLALAICSKILS